MSDERTPTRPRVTLRGISSRAWEHPADRGFLNFSSKGGERQHPDRWAQIKPETQWEIETGAKVTAGELYRASAIRSRWYAAAHRMLADYDALVMPVVQAWPFRADERWPQEIAGRRMDTYHRWMEVVVPVSLIGLPSLAVPVGFGANGLPMGIQIAGRHGADAAVLALGETYHRATRWPEKNPPRL